ncbi:MAG: hypothetical protein QOG77_1404 [Solirubrobacteraceae bacterium]|nr:hypothetical protein [Solirubrobacteraceae bacterium]
MSDGVMLWAGKHLTDDEELRTRRLVSMLRRVGDDDVAVGAEQLLLFADESVTMDA